jgi:hypothetical protein
MKLNGYRAMKRANPVRCRAALRSAVVVEDSAQHLQRKLTLPISNTTPDDAALSRILGGSARPGDAFAAVFYEGAWFRIANEDWKSKRAFSSILSRFPLANAGGTQALSTITIPAQ